MDSAETLLCDELHNAGCQEPLLPGYRYCPVCGRPASLLEVLGAKDGSLAFTLSTGETSKNVRLQNQGPGSLPVRVRIQGQNVSLRTQSIQLQPGTPHRPSSKLLEICFQGSLSNPSASPPSADGTADLIFTTDVEPRENDPWAKRDSRDYRLRIHWSARRPGNLKILTPCLFFHNRGSLRRPLRLMNDGGMPVPIILPALPPYFVFVEVDGTQRDLSPGEEISLYIEYCGPRSMQAGSDDVFFTTPAGAVPFRLVTRETVSGGARPEWIVAVDFGTSNTSIVARSVPSDGTDGICISLPGPEGDKRFPSAMYYQFEGREWLFGQRALNAAVAEGARAAGYLIHDHNSLKMSLSKEGEFYQREPAIIAAPGAKSAFTSSNLLQTYLKHLNESILRPFFEKIPKAHVHYVLSVPVLDGVGNEKHERHRKRLTDAFKRVMDVPDAQITTEFEPTCAANHLLLGQGFQYLQKTLTRTDSLFPIGERFMVVDSGGGTTDIVFGEFREGGAGTASFFVLGNLGLDEKRQDFGGRGVSDYLHNELNTSNHPEYLRQQFHHAPCELQAVQAESEDASEPSRDTNLSETSFGETCVRISEKIETLKRIYILDRVPETMPAGLATQLRAFTRDKIRSLIRRLKQTHPAAYDKPLRWLFLVGGNTLSLAVQDTCCETLARGNLDIMPNLPDEDRFLAVAMGATFAYGTAAKEYSQYQLTLLLQGEQDHIAGRMQIHNVQAKARAIHDEKFAPIDFAGDISVILKADDAVLLDEQVRGGDHTTRFESGIINGCFKLTARNRDLGTAKVLYESVI